MHGSKSDCTKDWHLAVSGTSLKFALHNGVKSNEFRGLKSDCHLFAICFYIFVASSSSIFASWQYKDLLPGAALKPEYRMCLHGIAA